MLDNIYYFFSNSLIHNKKSENNKGIVWSRKHEDKQYNG
jgi:hypothetical protein